MKRPGGSFASLAPLFARVGLLGGAALALAASSEAGDRAGTGACPIGESCAPDTPDGLLFEGAPLGTWPILTAHTIAAGGRQSFRITYAKTGAPFDLPFEADVTGAGHSVVAVGSDRVSVGATTAATGYLRIMNDIGELYDRLEIESAEISRMRAAPSYGSAYPSFNPGKWAAFAGGRTTVSIELFDGQGRNVVDEDLAIRGAFTRTGWDSFAMTMPPVAGSLVLDIEAGNVTDSVAVDVVDSFDDVNISAPSESGVGGDVTVCFTTWRRGMNNDNSDRTLVLGVPRQYRVTGPASPLPTQQYASCLELRTEANGTVQVEAIIGGQSHSASIAVRGMSAREAGGFTEWLWAPSEGERAVLASE